MQIKSSNFVTESTCNMLGRKMCIQDI